MINSVKFNAKVKQGIIEIPQEYQTNLVDRSEINVVISFQNEPKQEYSLMDELAKNPISVKRLSKLTRDEIHIRE
ncbi:MAG: hypothetical protein VKL60_14370 [Sphaerospermopsis sp.]|nr:hypothetical protein [Sphaerospermopsis sp.]